MKQFEVVKWWTMEGKTLALSLWVGTDERGAWSAACKAFLDALIEDQYPERLPEDPVELQKVYDEFKPVDFGKNPPCRITILEVLDQSEAERGQLPPILHSFGDETIDIFPRCSQKPGPA